jgi:hypothetical protein
MMKRALYLPILFVILSASVCQGQAAATPEVGANPFKSYSGGDIDHIQMQNGSLYLRIPLVSYPQKGKLSLSFSLLANGSQWQEYGWCDGTGGCDYEYASGFSISMLCNFPAPSWPEGGPANVQVVVDQDLSSNGCTNADVYPYNTFYWNSSGIIDSSQAIHPLGYNPNNWSQMQATDGSGYTVINPCITSISDAATGTPSPGCDAPITTYESNGVKHFLNTIPSGETNPLEVLTFQDPAGNSIARTTYTSPYYY